MGRTLFVVEYEIDKDYWVQVAASEISFHAIRTAREDSEAKKRVTRVVSVEAGGTLITFDKGSTVST